MDYIGRALVADALQEWREQLRDGAGTSSLRDVTTTDAHLLDIRHSHPKGLASLFAGRATPATTLIPERGAQATALHRLRLMIAAANEVKASTGTWSVALAIGTAAWNDGAVRREMPVILRPVDLEDTGSDVLLTLHASVSLNPVLALELRSRDREPRVANAPLELPAGRQFDPRPVWEEITSAAEGAFEEFTIRDRLVVGAYDDPEQRLVDDLDDLGDAMMLSSVISAVAGDAQAYAELSQPLPAPPSGHRDPFAERGLGELDDTVFAGLDVVATGRDVFFQAPPGADVAGTAAALVADAAASGRTALVVGGTLRALDDIALRLGESGADDLVIHGSPATWDVEARARLLEAITMDAPTVDTELMRDCGTRLVEARTAVQERMDLLHQPHRPWGVSAFEAVQALVRLTTGDTTPATQVRLGPDAAAVVADHGVAAVAKAIVEHLADDQAEPPPDEEVEETPVELVPWWSSVTSDAEQGRIYDEALATLVVRLVPKMRTEAVLSAEETGLDEATTFHHWMAQVHLFEHIREDLEYFTAEVFHRSVRDVVEATAPPGSAHYTDMPRRDRKALVRQGIEWLRPGRGTEDLHRRLALAEDHATQWRAQCSSGARPSVPDDFDLYGQRIQETHMLWSVIADVVRQVAGVEDLWDQPWERVAHVLEGLAEGIPGTVASVDTGATAIDIESMGFAALVEDLAARKATPAQVRADLEFAWWGAAFESMFTAKPELIQVGALARAVDDYLAYDSEFSHLRSGPLLRAVAERRRTAIAKDPEAARDLFAGLMEDSSTSYRSLLRAYPDIVKSLRPVIMTTPDQVPRALPAGQVVDLTVVVAAESLALAELIPAIARARHVVVLGDAHSATRSAIAALAQLLPQWSLRALPSARDPRVGTFLGNAAYGKQVPTYAAATDAGTLDVRVIDAQGEPAAGSAVVESTRSEVLTVVQMVSALLDHVPHPSVAIVAGNEVHAARIEHECATRGGVLATVPVVALGDAAGFTVDHVVIATGYARDTRGTVPSHVGVLSQDWGSQALVQAVVAAQRDITVVTSLTADQWGEIAIAAGDNSGADDLRDLIDLGGRAAVIPERPEPGPSDWLLADVAGRLRQRGLAVHVRYGFGADVIPMVVGGPHDRSYSVAVITDEPRPGDVSSLRDRLRGQRAALKAVGWTVVPLWTLDVFMDPSLAVNAILGALGLASEPEPTHVPPTPAPPAPATASSALFVEEPEPEPEPDPEPEPEPEPEPSPPDVAMPAGLGFGVPKSSAPATPTRGPGRPLIPTKAWEDQPESWGERESPTRDDDLRRDKPPHW